MVLVLLCGECRRGHHEECGGFLPPPGGKKETGGALCCCDCKIATDSVQEFMKKRLADELDRSGPVVVRRIDDDDA